ncbi:helix-turn-helix domain-containing protein [Actinomadura rugatobispora]|uniref:GAF domain-containing protein n=1 Tax=Actinomadura rugatobispora TaxID=1994 RepID=A0ABW1A3N1_9ACTN|nr:GAF domain-containing protein [Actinomadura rugatobispora]
MDRRPGDPEDPVRVLRPPISESWRRSREAGITVAISAAPQVYDRGDLAEVRAGHLLVSHVPAMRGLLRSYTDETGHLMVVSDADGHALWSEGAPAALREAARIGLLEGFCWSERSIGTNGIGTALATGAPQYVFSAEHLVPALHRWSCAGAPITDPDTGRVIGCVEVSGTAEALHPAAVALVGAAAALAEARLELEMRRRDEAMRERHRRHLDALRGEPGALATPTGRILLAEPAEWCGRRLHVPVSGGPAALPDGRWALAEPVGEVFLLRAPPGGRRRPPPQSPSAPGPVTVRPDAEDPPSSEDTGTLRAEPTAPPPGSMRHTAHAPAGDLSGATAPAAPGVPMLALAFLGDDPPSAWLDGRRLPLSLRHAEILALLALHPRGLNADRLSLHLYGGEGSPVTVRAEIHRLRAQLGDFVGAKPYRLDCAVDADFLAVRRLLEAGEVAGAVRLSRGDLLPHSDAPAIRAERDELSVLLRSRLLEHGGVESLWTYACTETGRDDLEVMERLQELLPPADVRRDTVAARHHRLLTEDD